MATAAPRPKLVVIVGPTASGKSQLALRIAQEYNGEIIAADSRTIYRGMEIGTAKPSPEDQSKVKHWGLDLVEPGQPFSAYKFKTYTQEAIADIRKREKMPILVGGTGLYIDAVLFDFSFGDPANHKNRKILERLSVNDLQKIIRERGYAMPENSLNRRHLIRTIERKGLQGTRQLLKPGTLAIGLQPDDEVLKRRISDRAEIIFENGVIKETEELLKKYSKESLDNTGGIIYKICLRLLAGKIDEKEALQMFKQADWHYARRQRTWFRRHKFIQWFRTPDEAFTSVGQLLNK